MYLFRITRVQQCACCSVQFPPAKPDRPPGNRPRLGQSRPITQHPAHPLPAPLQPSAGARLPFVPVCIRGNHAYISGHGPLDAGDNITGPFGKVGTDVTPEQAYTAARLTMLAMLADLRTALGSLDRITAWLKLLGLVNAAPGFNALPGVVNGASDLVLDLFGPDIGAHSRSAIGVAELPWNIPFELEAQEEIA